MVCRVLVLCATEPEIRPFLDRHRPDKKGNTPWGGNIYSGSLGGTGYDILISGPGVFNTAVSLTAFLEKVLPDLILDTGIAGVFKGSGLGLGDAAVADRERYLPAGIDRGGTDPEPLPFDLIPSRPSTRKGIYPMDQNLVDKYLGCLEPKHQDPGGSGPRAGRGTFLTVSAVTGSKGLAQGLFDRFCPVMESMEGACAAHTAALYQVPFVEIRAGSNFVGDRDKSNWDISGAADRVAGICEQVILDP